MHGELHRWLLGAAAAETIVGLVSGCRKAGFRVQEDALMTVAHSSSDGDTAG